MEMESRPLASPRYAVPRRSLAMCLEAARHFFQWHWHAYRDRRACQQTATLLSELDEHQLKDIGAPAWARLHAAALRDLNQRHREQWLRL